MFALVLSGFTCKVEIRHHNRQCVLVYATCHEDFPTEQHEELLFVGGGEAAGSYWVYVLPPNLQPGFNYTLGNSVRVVQTPIKCTFIKVVIYTPAACMLCTNDVHVVDHDLLTIPGLVPHVYNR